VLIPRTFYAMTGGLILQWLLGCNFSAAVWVGYVALFGIAVETGVIMVRYLPEALIIALACGHRITNKAIRTRRSKRQPLKEQCQGFARSC